MPLRSPEGIRWFSGHAIRLHGLLAVVVPLCLLAGWWQATRAMSGNTLSYFYAAEWPCFAAIAVYAWWQLLHTPPRSEPPTPVQHDDRNPDQPLRWDPSHETPELRAYNAYLADLHDLPGKG